MPFIRDGMDADVVAGDDASNADIPGERERERGALFSFVRYRLNRNARSIHFSPKASIFVSPIM